MYVFFKCPVKNFLFFKSQKKTRQSINELKHNKPKPNIFQSEASLGTLKVVVNTNHHAWEPHEVMADGLVLQIEVGDIQTPVCILIALGERRNDLPITDIVYVSFLLA